MSIVDIDDSEYDYQDDVEFPDVFDPESMFEKFKSPKQRPDSQEGMNSIHQKAQTSPVQSEADASHSGS